MIGNSKLSSLVNFLQETIEEMHYILIPKGFVGHNFQIFKGLDICNTVAGFICETKYFNG